MKKHSELKTFATLMGIGTGIVHIYNKYIQKTAENMPSASVSNEFTFDWEFGQVTYGKNGKGSPLLLIHDVSPESSKDEWNKVIRSLASCHTVFSIDLPGCGKSSRNNIKYTGYFYVRFINDFIKFVVKEPAIIVASRLSAAYALEAAALNKDCVSELFLVNPLSISGLQRTPSRKNKILRHILQVPVFGTLIYNMLVSREAMYDRLINRSYNNPFKLKIEDFDTSYKNAHIAGSANKDLVCAVLDGYMNVNLEAVLKKIETPIHIITGDFPSDIKIAKEYTSLDPEIDCYAVDDAGTFPYIEQPQRFTEIISEVIS